MKALFILPLTDPIFPFQIASLSSFLKKEGHLVDYLQLMIRGDLTDAQKAEARDKAREFKPDIIGLSCYEMTFEWVKDIADVIKTGYKDGLVIAGGYYPTLSPEEVLNHPSIDMVCIGEGEGPLADLGRALRENKADPNENIDNIWFKKGNRIIKNKVRPLAKNLDALPFVDRAFFDYQRYINNFAKTSGNRILEIMGSRGCPFNCTYCSNHAFRKIYPDASDYVRQRSVENILDEIGTCRENFEFEAVFFHDDTFTFSKKWLSQFCELYPRRFKMPFYCNVRVETVGEPEMEMLKSAGCGMISVGVESGDESIRKEVLNRIVKDSQIKKVFALARKHRIDAKSFNMVGMPGETIISLMKTVRLNLVMGPKYVQTSVFYPFRGTELGDFCYRNNMVDAEKKKKLRLYADDSILKLGIPNYVIRLAKWCVSATALRRNFFEMFRLGLRVFLRRFTIGIGAIEK